MEGPKGLTGDREHFSVLGKMLDRAELAKSAQNVAK